MVVDRGRPCDAKTALVDAHSVAALMMTTEAMIADSPSEDGGAGGMPDLASMMNNPAMMQAAQKMMQNPAMMEMAKNLMADPNALSNMMNMMGGGGQGGGPDMSQMAAMMNGMAGKR